MKKCLLLAPLILLMACLCCGCGITNVEEGERKAVEYTVLKTDAIPPEVAEVIKALGPETKEEQKGDGSVPYLVIKTEDLELPVVFE